MEGQKRFPTGLVKEDPVTLSVHSFRAEKIGTFPFFKKN